MWPTSEPDARAAACRHGVELGLFGGQLLVVGLDRRRHQGDLGMTAGDVLAGSGQRSSQPTSTSPFSTSGRSTRASRKARLVLAAPDHDLRLCERA